MKVQKIYILGVSGSGKTFLGRLLSKKLKIPLYDSDDVRFVRKFSKSRNKKQRKKLIDNIIKKSKWIIDARGTAWDRHAMKKSDLVIWLQTPARKRGPRILKRYGNRKGGFEENIHSILHLLKYSLNYRFGKRITSFREHKSFLEKNNLNYIVIKNKRQLNKSIKNLTE